MDSFILFYAATFFAFVLIRIKSGVQLIRIIIPNVDAKITAVDRLDTVGVDEPQHPIKADGEIERFVKLAQHFLFVEASLQVGLLAHNTFVLVFQIFFFVGRRFGGGNGFGGRLAIFRIFTQVFSERLTHNDGKNSSDD